MPTTNQAVDAVDIPETQEAIIDALMREHRLAREAKEREQQAKLEGKTHKARIKAYMQALGLSQWRHPDGLGHCDLRAAYDRTGYTKAVIDDHVAPPVPVLAVEIAVLADMARRHWVVGFAATSDEPVSSKDDGVWVPLLPVMLTPEQQAERLTQAALALTEIDAALSSARWSTRVESTVAIS